MHKRGTPLRPIVSFKNSPTYALLKHLVSILSPLVGKSPSHVRNSTEFAFFITRSSINQEMTMVSFDVVTLFTKVPATKVAHQGLTADPSLVVRSIITG